MNQRFFVGDDGLFVGSYDGPNESMPEGMRGLTQVPSAPDDWRQVWDGRTWLPYTRPDPVKLIYAVHLWERLSKVEADKVGEAMQAQDFRTRKIFESASSYRSDHELWPLLEGIATQLFGDARAAEILTPSELVIP